MLRYNRQIILRGFDFEGCEALKDARALVVGLAAGCAATQYSVGRWRQATDATRLLIPLPFPISSVKPAQRRHGRAASCRVRLRDALARINPAYYHYAR